MSRKIRVQSIDYQVVVNILMPLTKEHQDKMENKDYEKALNDIANDLHVDWSIEVCGNQSEACISRTLGPIATNEDVDNLENDAISFMAAVEKAKLQKSCPVKKNPKPQLDKELEFAKEILDEWDETEDSLGVVGAEIMGGTKDCPFAFPIRHISGDMLKRMLEAFITQNGRS